MGEGEKMGGEGGQERGEEGEGEEEGRREGTPHFWGQVYAAVFPSLHAHTIHTHTTKKAVAWLCIWIHSPPFLPIPAGHAQWANVELASA